MASFACQHLPKRFCLLSDVIAADAHAIEGLPLHLGPNHIAVVAARDQPLDHAVGKIFVRQCGYLHRPCVASGSRLGIVGNTRCGWWFKARYRLVGGGKARHRHGGHGIEFLLRTATRRRAEVKDCDRRRRKNC